MPVRGALLTGCPTDRRADSQERAAPSGHLAALSLGLAPAADGTDSPAAPGARTSAAGCPGRSQHGLVASERRLPMALRGALTRLPKSGRRSGLGPVAMRPGAVRGVAPAPRALPGGGIRRPPTREVTPPAISATGSSRESRDSPPVREEAAPLAARERRPTFRQARVAQQRWRQATKPKPGSGSVVRLRGAARGARRPWRRRSRPRAASKNS